MTSNDSPARLVLIVDDDAVLARTYARILEGAGLQVSRRRRR